MHHHLGLKNLSNFFLASISLLFCCSCFSSYNLQVPQHSSFSAFPFLFVLLPIFFVFQLLFRFPFLCFLLFLPHFSIFLSVKANSCVPFLNITPITEPKSPNFVTKRFLSLGNLTPEDFLQYILEENKDS